MNKLKIAYLANVRFPSERAHAAQMAHMCQAFAVSGSLVDLVVSTKKTGEINSVNDYFNIESKFGLIRIPYGFQYTKVRIGFLASEFFFAAAFIFKGLHQKYDILFSRSEWMLYFFSFFLKNKRLVWESHEAKFNLAARRLIQKKVKIVVISKGIRDFYLKKSVPQEILLIADDAVDEAYFGYVETKFQARERLTLPIEKRIVMYIGGFDAWKGVEIFLQASSSLKDVLFVAIGGTYTEVEHYMSRYPNAVFLGQKPYAELKDNQQAADVLVIPNTLKSDLSSKYTSPLKLFAHMASGVPLVVTAVDSIVTITGLDDVTVVKPDNQGSLVRGIKTVFRTYDEAIVKAKRIKKSSVNFTWSNRAVKIINFISQ